MNQSADEEVNPHSGDGAEFPSERLKEELMSEVAEGRVPATTPEFAEARGSDRFLHEGFGVESIRTPVATEQCEETEVEDLQQADDSEPASDEVPIGGEER